jgi:hypothetical protein
MFSEDQKNQDVHNKDGAKDPIDRIRFPDVADDLGRVNEIVYRYKIVSSSKFGEKEIFGDDIEHEGIGNDKTGDPRCWFEIEYPVRDKDCIQDKGNGEVRESHTIEKETHSVNMRQLKKAHIQVWQGLEEKYCPRDQRKGHEYQEQEE